MNHLQTIKYATMVVGILVLQGCCGFQGCVGYSDAPSYRSGGPYVETENISWDHVTEEEQELADQI